MHAIKELTSAIDRGQRMPKKVGSRFCSVTKKRNRGRFPVTQKSDRGRFPVTLGYTKLNQGRFPATLGYTKRDQGQFPVMLWFTKTSRRPKDAYPVTPYPGYRGKLLELPLFIKANGTFSG